MKKLEINSRKSVILTAITFTLIVITIILLVISRSSKLPPVFIGIPFLIAGLTSIVGLIYGLKSIPEKNSARKILSLVFNSMFCLCFIAFIIGDLVSK